MKIVFFSPYGILRAFLPLWLHDCWFCGSYLKEIVPCDVGMIVTITREKGFFFLCNSIKNIKIITSLVKKL